MLVPSAFISLTSEVWRAPWVLLLTLWTLGSAELLDLIFGSSPSSHAPQL